MAALLCDPRLEPAHRSRWSGLAARAAEEMTMLYTMRFDEGYTETHECVDLAAAEELATQLAREGDYGEIESTIWVDVWISHEQPTECSYCDAVSVGIDDDGEPACAGCGGDEINTHHLTRKSVPDAHLTVSIDPDEPECSHDDGHSWRDLGDRCHGGGIISRAECRHCGVTRVCDSWAQRPDTGEQSLDSVRYESADQQLMVTLC